MQSCYDFFGIARLSDIFYHAPNQVWEGSRSGGRSAIARWDVFLHLSPSLLFSSLLWRPRLWEGFEPRIDGIHIVIKPLAPKRMGKKTEDSSSVEEEGLWKSNRKLLRSLLRLSSHSARWSQVKLGTTKGSSQVKSGTICWHFLSCCAHGLAST